MATTTGSREARRRRILERGSDRLALITGRIDSIPSSPPSDAHRHLHTVSLPPSLDHDHHHPDSTKPNLSHQFNATSQDEEDVTRAELARSETSNESIRSATIEPQLRNCETHVGTTRTPALDLSRTVQPPLVASTAQEPLDSAVDEPSPYREARPHSTRFLTAKRISSSISVSENIRILSALTIAIIVVVSHLRIPLLSSNIAATIITTMPVYLVLLTDVTICLARLLFWKQEASKKAKEEIKIGRSEDEYSWVGLVSVLDIGLVLYKAITAAFMDCSVYLVVVICGFSLLPSCF